MSTRTMQSASRCCYHRQKLQPQTSCSAFLSARSSFLGLILALSLSFCSFFGTVIRVFTCVYLCVLACVRKEGKRAICDTLLHRRRCRAAVCCMRWRFVDLSFHFPLPFTACSFIAVSFSHVYLSHVMLCPNVLMHVNVIFPFVSCLAVLLAALLLSSCPPYPP